MKKVLYLVLALKNLIFKNLRFMISLAIVTSNEILEIVLKEFHYFKYCIHLSHASRF